MAPRFDTISFLSDYGTSDEFVGVVKSVIRAIEPGATVIDITHDVPPYDVKAGSLARRTWSGPTTACWARPSAWWAAPRPRSS